MDILYLLVPLSLVLALLIGAVFWFALRSGQFDDLDGPALRVVLDDDRPQSADHNLSTDSRMERQQAVN